MKLKGVKLLLSLLLSLPYVTIKGSEMEDLANDFLAKGRAFLNIQPDSALFYSGMANAYSKEHQLPLQEAQSAQLMAQVYYWKGDVNAARDLYQSARKTLVQAQANPKDIATALLEMAYLESSVQNYNRALELSLEIKQLFPHPDKLENHSFTHAKVLGMQGRVFEDLGSYDLALENYNTAMDLYQELADSNGISEMYGHIGNVRLLMGDNREALKTYQEALDLERIRGNRMGEMMSLCQMGLVELSRGNPHEARDAHFSALAIAQTDGMNKGIADNRMYIGRICLEMEDYDSALVHYQQAYQIWAVPGIKSKMAESKVGMAQAQYAKGQLREALECATGANELAKESDRKKVQVEALELTSLIYERQSAFKKSLAAQREAKKISQELFEQEQASKNTEMRVRFEHQKDVAGLAMAKTKQDMDLAMQREVIRQNTVIQSVLIGVFFLGLFFVVLLIRSLRINRKKNHQLEERGEMIKEKNEELKTIGDELQATNANLEALVDERTEALKRAVDSLIEVNEELDTFIYRASHDLLGPIARLKGLSMLLRQAETINDPGVYVELIDSVAIYMDRVLRKLILVHDIRKPKSKRSQASIPDIIEEIKPGLYEIPGIETPLIHLDCQISDAIPFPEELVRVALENVLENACIFRDKSSGGCPEISIKATVQNDMLVIETRDFGIGIPNEIKNKVFDIFFRGSERSKGNGLGLYLVRMAVEAMEGKVQLESEAGQYTMVRFSLPLNEKEVQELKAPAPVHA